MSLHKGLEVFEWDWQKIWFKFKHFVEKGHKWDNFFEISYTEYSVGQGDNRSFAKTVKQEQEGQTKLAIQSFLCI